jgi:2-polyprenyl-3-methyl-5-hydroxy-6-metoxy-1,4-benzoquinol methylase
MGKDRFREYSEKHIHFFEEDVPELLKSIMFLKVKGNREFSIVDLGCGDGRLIYPLYKKGLLEKAKDVVGVDISRERINRLSKNIPFVKGIVSDASYVKELADNSFDIVVCSQVIEHVKDDNKLISEIRRILKPGVGIAFISSVIKKWWGMYLFLKNGSFRLDPTHVREYSSKEEFISLIERNDLKPIKVKVQQIKYPFLDLVIRALISSNIVKPDPMFFQRVPALNNWRSRIKLPIIGYQTIEVTARK